MFAVIQLDIQLTAAGDVQTSMELQSLRLDDPISAIDYFRICLEVFGSTFLLDVSLVRTVLGPGLGDCSQLYRISNPQGRWMEGVFPVLECARCTWRTMG